MIEDNTKVSDLSVKQFRDLTAGVNHTLLDSWLEDVTEKVSHNLAGKIDMQIDARLMSIGIDPKQPKFEQAKQAWVEGVMKDAGTFKSGILTQAATVLASNALLLGAGYIGGLFG